MIIFFLVVLVIFGAIAMFADWGKDASQKHKEKVELQNINDNIETLFQQRVNALGIHIENAIEVLTFSDPDDRTCGIYRHMWYENGAIGFFTSIRPYNDTKFYSSPLNWKVTWIERSNIEGLYLRGNVCKLTTKDGGGLSFDASDYDKIKKLFDSNGIECNYT